MMQAVFRKAAFGDVDAIMEIVYDAQQSLGSRGINQWQNGYPNREAIISDINKGVGVVAKQGETIAAYAAIVVNGEPEYKNLVGGQWLSDDDYIVVHRICVRNDFVRKGLASAVMQYAIDFAKVKGIHSFKIDTHIENQYMLNMLNKFGFTYCGEIHYEHGDRVAFEKII